METELIEQRQDEFSEKLIKLIEEYDETIPKFEMLLNIITEFKHLACHPYINRHHMIRYYIEALTDYIKKEKIG